MKVPSVDKEKSLGDGSRAWHGVVTGSRYGGCQRVQVWWVETGWPLDEGMVGVDRWYLLLVEEARVVVVVEAETAAVVVVTHAVCDIDPLDPSNMLSFFTLELTQAAPQSSWLKDVAPENMYCMSVTRDTSHLDRSWLKDFAP